MLVQWGGAKRINGENLFGQCCNLSLKCTLLIYDIWKITLFLVDNVVKTIKINLFAPLYSTVLWDTL